MKTLNKIVMAALAAGTVQMAGAFNYTPGDLILVFRQDNTKNVEFNLGSVTNYLGLAPGSQVPVTYAKSTVQANFSNLGLVRFGIVGTTAQADTAPRVWLSDAKVYSAPATVSFSQFSVLNSKVEGVGVSATIVTKSNAAPYIVATTDPTSYDYIVSSGWGSAVSTMYGDTPTAVGAFSPLPVDALNPATVALYEVTIGNGQGACTLVGAFTLDVNWNLTFTAGQLPPLAPASIVNISADTLGGASTVSFNSVSGRKYQLLYSTVVGGAWQPVPNAVAYGDGSVQNLTDPDASDPARFYRIKTTY